MDYSVVIPAYNEAATIGPVLSALKRAMAPLPYSGEIVVTDNHSTDATGTIAAEHGARVVFEPVNQISRARNTGAAAARGRHLVFVDADTLVPGSLLKTALAALDTGALGGGGATILADRPLPVVAALGLAFWNRVSSATGIAAGSFIFCIADGFREVGGFDEAVYVGEEFFFSRRYRKWCAQRGLPFRILRAHPVVSSARKVEWYSPAQFLLMTISMFCFPLVMRFKSLCGFWYHRPERRS